MTTALLAGLAALTLAGALAPRRGRHPAPEPGWWPAIEARVGRRILAADLPPVLQPTGRTCGVVAVGTVVACALGAWVVAGAAAVLVGGLGLAIVARGDRSEDMVVRQLPTLVDGITRQLRVGRSLTQALDDLRLRMRFPLDHDLERVVSAVGRGQPVVDALHQWAQRYQAVDVRVVSTALGLGQQAGGPRTRTLEAVARSLRDRHAVAGELTAQTAQARVSALVVGVAPVAFGTALLLLGVAPAPTWSDPVIVGSLTAGLALDAMGLVWMRRLTRLRW